MNPGKTVKEAILEVEIKEISSARRSIDVMVPADQVAAEYDKACRKYARSLKVPGFRKGKVPPHIIRQRFGHEIEQETVEQAIDDALRRAIKENDLKPLRMPTLKTYSYEHGKPLTFTSEFDVRPKVVIKGVDTIKVTETRPAVTDKMISEALESLRERSARFDPVEGRGVAPGDHILMNVKGRTQGREDEGDTFSRDDLLIEIGSGGPHPELSDPLRDAMPDETREFDIQYPEDHPAPDFAGKKITYTVTVREIKTKVFPDLDDEFARDLGSFDTLEALKTKVSEDLMARERRRGREEARGKVVDELLEINSEVEVPASLMDEEVDRRVEDFARGLALQGMDPRTQAVDWDDIRQKQREPAMRAVRATILLDAIAEEKKISIEPDALDRAIAVEAKRRRESPESLRAQLTKDGRLEGLSRQLVRERVLDNILATANT